MTPLLAITVFQTAYTLSGVFGFTMFAAGVTVTLPKFLVDTPFDFFASLISSRRLIHLHRMLNSHIRDEWPDTKVLAFLIYGGELLLIVSALCCLMDSYTS